MRIELWSRRALILAAVICLPFLGYLTSNGYPLCRAETAVALGLLLTTTLTLSALCRGAAFYAAVLCCGCVVSAAPVQRLLRPAVHLPEAGAAGVVGLATVVLILWLRRRFFELLLAFAIGTFAAHWLAHNARPALAQWLRPAQASGPAVSGHVLHIVLDEQMGPACLPEPVPECREASAALERTLASYGFRLYPRAYSNYPWTFDSVPSVLAGALAQRSGQWLRGGGPDENRVLSFDAHSLFALFRRRGYEVASFEDARLRFAPPGMARVVRFPGELATVGELDWPWSEKFRVIVAHYQASSSVLSRFKGLFPLFRFGQRSLSPLAAPPDWPRLIADEILAARRPIFFFAHVLLPHGPYAYDGRGRVLTPADWRGDHYYDLQDGESYRRLYSAYCRQVLTVAGQLETLLARLREGGALGGMTVVVHGDHGSRIRLRRPEVTRHRQAAPELFDYGGTPPLEDLLDRFSILLAYKAPGTSTPSYDERIGGLLRFVRELYWSGEPAAPDSAADEAYLFDEQGKPIGIPLGVLWKESSRSCATSIRRPGASPFRF